MIPYSQPGSDSDIEALLPPRRIFNYIWLLVAGLVLPAILIPIVKVTGYSEVVEEISKCLVVVLLIVPLSGLRRQILWGIIFGLLFSISETIFFLPAIYQMWGGVLVLYRLVLTVPMHALTTVILTLSARNKKTYLIIVGLALAITIHLLFNYQLIPALF